MSLSLPKTRKNKELCKMTDYNKTITKAKNVKNNVEKNQKLGESSNWAYYFAKTILNVNKNVKQINIKKPKSFEGTYISRDIYKSSYVDMATRLVKYVEKNYQLPAYIKFVTKSGKEYQVNVSMYTYLFAKTLVAYNTSKKLPAKTNISSKVFVKESEPSNIVYKYFVEKTGKKFRYIDDLLEYVAEHFTYEFYFDDYKSNKQVIDSFAGNCTDLLQFLINMAEEMGYEWKVIHTECRQSGTGHVYAKFRKGGEWFVRDIACIADEGRFCVWCDVDEDRGYLLATNPSWFLTNLNR